MNNLCGFLSFFHGNTSFMIPFPDSNVALLNLSVSMNNTVERWVYIGLIFFLFISGVLLVYALQEQKKKNRILQNGERMRSDLFAKITHEFRTPLTIILGLSKQLREQKELSGNNTITYLTAIERQGRYLSELVNQLLDMANLRAADDSIEWKTGNIVSFVEMVAETYSLYARQQDMELQFFSDETEIETDFVPGYLNKILSNLLSNAIKYSEPGSKINIVLSRDKRDPQKIIIKVIDHGKGIKKEDLPHIFDLFYKSPDSDSQKSSGIGLTLTKQLVEILDGTIRVETNEHKGSEFTVVLPLRRSSKTLYPYWLPGEKNHFPAAEKMKNAAENTEK